MRAYLLPLLTLLPLACGDDTGRDSASAGISGGISSASGPSTTAGSDSASTDPSTSGDSGSASQGSTGTTGTTGTTAASSPGSTTAVTGESSTSGETLTTGDPTTGDPTTGDEVGCDRVDFLFVIDNSSSMEAKQAALKAAFPQFIATIKATVKAQDYHIMVVDTDAWGKCDEQECAKGPDKNEVCNAYICKTKFNACDETLGAGVLHPAGKASSNQKCSIQGNNRYLLSSDPDLTGSFKCVAKLGLAGNGKERPLDAMVAALADPINGPGGCNDGFLRDDAILVITMISDDPNKEDMTSPAAAYNAVVAAKNGDADRIVALGLIPDPNMGCPQGKPEAGVHWANFISMFGEHGFVAPVCVENYNDFFQEAASIIDQTCEINPG